MLPSDRPLHYPSKGTMFRSRRGHIALGIGLLVVGFVLAFDGTWFRPLIQRHVQERSGRQIDFDALHIGLNASLQPTVRVRNLLIQNARWAASNRPLVRADEVGFTFSWQGLFRSPTLVTRLDLVDAEIDLERQADGLRNWRITRPDDRGPGRVRVQSIEARNTRVHVIDRAQRLELDLQVAVLDTPVTLAAQPALPLVRSITLQGLRDGTSFQAQVDVSLLPTFFDTGRAFAMRGVLQAGSAQASFEGALTDLMQLARADVAVELAGARMVELGAVAGLGSSAAGLPALPTKASAQLVKDGPRWAISRLRAQVGRSDLAGSAEFVGQSPGAARSTLRASLTSDRIDLAGLRAARAPGGAASAPDTGAKRALDADVEWKIGTLEGALPVALTKFAAHATLRDDRAALEALQFTVAGGRASGALEVDTARAPAGFALDLRLQGVQLAQLSRSGGRENRGGVSGGLNARLALRTHGDSATDLAAATTGSVTAELVRATIPDALDAKLALDGGHLLRSMFGVGSERSAVTCSALELNFDRGRGAVRRLAFATDRVDVVGAGWVDLGSASLDLVLTPHRKQSALFSLDRSMRLRGPMKAPKLALVDRDEAKASGAVCTPAAAS